MPTTEPNVATIIWRQIPVGVKMSMGARDPISDGNTLRFRAGPGSKTYRVSVTLNGGDTYDIKVEKMNRKTYELTTLGSADDVYVENLGRVLLSLEKHLT